MRYVMKTEWPNVRTISTSEGEIVARAAYNSGAWLLISWLDRAAVTSGPSLAGLLIDAGFEGIVEFQE